VAGWVEHGRHHETARFKYPACCHFAVTPHYQTIASYRELPPKYRVLEPEDPFARFAARYVDRLDSNAVREQETESSGEVHDLLSLILGRQASEHAETASTLSKLILNRRGLTRKQIDDIQWRIDGLMPRRPIHPLPEGKIAEAEKMIIDLERQKRQAEVNEWRDLLELRRAIMEERRAYEGAEARWRYLGGGGLGAGAYGTTD